MLTATTGRDAHRTCQSNGTIDIGRQSGSSAIAGKKGKTKSKSRSRHSRKPKQSWCQSTGQWNKEIFVCTGFNAKEILKGIKRIGAKDWFLTYAEGQLVTWQKLIDGGCAFVAREPVHGAYVMRLRPYSDSWDFWEVLIHELNHLVDYMAEGQAFEGETEAKAYLIEHLFHEIRRKLQGVVPKNSNNA